MNSRKSSFSFISALVITCFFIAPKAQAGMILMSIGAGEMFKQNASRPYVLGTIIPGGVMAMSGAILGITGLLAPAFVLITLSEDGIASREQLEIQLTHLYPMINDPEAVSELAQAIKNKNDSIEFQKQGLKAINLPSEVILEILTPTDLSEEEISAIVKDLK